MKEIFLPVQARAGAISGIKWVDWDKGQLDDFDQRPEVAFPCVLVKFNIDSTEDIGGNEQKCSATIELKLGFDFTGETSNAAPASVIENSLQYMDIVDEIFKQFQGYGTREFNKLSRKYQREDERGGYKVVRMGFSTGYIDKTAAV